MPNKGMLVRTVEKGFQPLNSEDFAKVQNGELIEVSWSKPRNPRFHRKMFALFRLVFEMLPHREFEPVVCKDGRTILPVRNFESTREWLTIEAGYYQVIGYPNGSVKVIPKSLSYSSMDQDEFEKFYSRVIDVALQVLPMYKSGTQLDGAVEDLLRFDG